VRRASTLFIAAAALWPAAARADPYVLGGPLCPRCFSVRVGDVIGAGAAPATITADGSNGSAQAG
jgi:hypothetical protein